MKTFVVAPGGRIDRVVNGEEIMINWRYRQAIKVTLALQAEEEDVILVIVGDGRQGALNKQAVRVAKEAGIKHIIESSRSMNTRDDMMAIAEVLPVYGPDRVIIVSCWYHVLRCAANFRLACAHFDVSMPALVLLPVWRDWKNGAIRWIRFWDGEPRGIFDALRHLPQNSRGNFAKVDARLLK